MKLHLWKGKKSKGSHLILSERENFTWTSRMDMEKMGEFYSHTEEEEVSFSKGFSSVLEWLSEYCERFDNMTDVRMVIPGIEISGWGDGMRWEEGTLMRVLAPESEPKEGGAYVVTAL